MGAKKVVLKENCLSADLTPLKEYEVKNEGNLYYTLMNDRGKERNYYKGIFSVEKGTKNVVSKP